MATENGFLNATVEAAFNRLAMAPFVDEIGFFGLEEQCMAAYERGMTVAELTRAVRTQYEGETE